MVDINKIGIVVLAAGKGKRMQSELPKVMHPLRGRPLIDYVVNVAEELKIKPVVVVADDSNLVRDYLSGRADYAVQTERLGTGHAVQMAEGALNGKVECVIVLYGDMPFIKAASLNNLIDDHMSRSNMLTLATVTVPDFRDWRAQFYDFGRIIRDENGDIIRIVEKKDASPAELNVMELNSAFFCFNAEWLWKNLKNLKNNNAAGELYLTDLVKIAFDTGVPLSSVNIDPLEAVGVNTKEHLEKAHNINKF
ncbi:MAG: NTP transferase domain-containing protein [Candidatus Magasanikbacteria bacterium]|nr:NTP transferase domain-containing protein [Candidatus Magasanikbacteria bacterium]